MEIKKFGKYLLDVKAQMLAGSLDEIPLNARPKMVDFDFDKDSYVIISYSRKDFAEVYLFLAYLYNEGYRFWYDAAMLGTDKWINEFREKYENPNCLGSVTFYSDNYVSDSTKEELAITFQQDCYAKQHMMISLTNLADIDPEKALKSALIADRISIENAFAIKPILSKLIQEEKARTIHRYSNEDDILALIEKLGKIFSIRINSDDDQQKNATGFTISGDILTKYTGTNAEAIVPNKTREIGHGAFRDCRHLTTAILPQGLTHIGEESFARCIALKQISIPTSVSYIGSSAFAECTNLQSITLPFGITEIKQNAFYFCAKLKDISIPNSVICIREGAFRYCAELKSIKIPNSVTYIGQNAFYFCTSLVDVAIPVSVTHIVEGAFAACLSLERVIYEGTMEQWKQLLHVDNNIKTIQCTDGVLMRE